jgi:hypothetical protein
MVRAVSFVEFIRTYVAENGARNHKIRYTKTEPYDHMVNRTHTNAKDDQAAALKAKPPRGGTSSPSPQVAGQTNAESAPVTDASEPQTLDPRYPIYWQYYIHLVEEQSQSQTELDKSILNLSLGALGVSFAIITALSGIASRVIDLPLVFASWVVFSIAIVATTESYNSSIQDYSQHILRAHSVIFGETSESTPSPETMGIASGRKLNWLNKSFQRCRAWLGTERLNITARVSFYFGIAFLLVFVGLNLIGGKPKSVDSTNQAQATKSILALAQAISAASKAPATPLPAQVPAATSPAPLHKLNTGHHP